MAINTRDRLIDVARQLIVRKGIENTTMSDIANASEKGRRTVYTYFKNKREIYDAVLQREGELRLEELEAIIALDIPADEKLRRFLLKRFEIIDSYVQSPSSANYIRSLFTSDLKRIERIRVRMRERQASMLDAIIREGIGSGIFEPEQAARLELALDVMIRGIDVIYIDRHHKRTQSLAEGFEHDLSDFIVQALKTDKQTN